MAGSVFAGFLFLAIAVVQATSNLAETAWAIDLDRFIDKLQKDHSHYFPNATIAETSIEEYRRFLYIHQSYPEHWVAASKLVDIVWHEHIIDTRAYMADCDRLFGHYLHHTPCFGDGRPFLYEKHMVNAYQKLFGEFPRLDIWQIAQPQADVGFPGCEIPQPPTPPGPPAPPPPCPPPPPPSYFKLCSSEDSEEELCIDGGDALASMLTLAKCNASESQAFDGVLSMGESSSWWSHEHGRCVELIHGNTTNGNQFTMQCCNHTRGEQDFHFNQTTGQIMYGLYPASSKCVDANKMIAGTALMIMDCTDEKQQRWDMSSLPSFTSKAFSQVVEYSSVV